MRKKILASLLLIFGLLSLSGCSFLFDIIEIGKDIISQYQNDNEYEYPDFDMSKIKTVGDLYTGSMPSIGKVNALVIMIEFKNDTAPSKYTQNYLQNAFFDDTNSNSVSGYYKKSSYGKLNITGDVLGWYKAQNTARYYENTYESFASDYIIKEALDYYYDSGVDLSNYDSDNDGYIDAVYGVYSKTYDEKSSLWWAYQSSYQSSKKEQSYVEYGNVKFSNYVWGSVRFLENDLFGNPKALTFIHETGHLMGLDDYYDYDESVGATGGLGCADMMDYNVGDHCSISKILLGWTIPTIIDLSDDETKLDNITLTSFTNTNNVLLVIDSSYENFFDEFFLIELYTPYGLNSSNNYFSKTGIRILHVDATLGSGGMSGEYFTYFNYDNSDTNRKFVTMVTPNGPFNDTFNGNANNNDLFYASDILTKDDGAFYDSDYSFSLRVLSINTLSNQAKITISK